jgi:hypothetical protein
VSAQSQPDSHDTLYKVVPDSDPIFGGFAERGAYYKGVACIAEHQKSPMSFVDTIVHEGLHGFRTDLQTLGDELYGGHLAIYQRAAQAAMRFPGIPVDAAVQQCATARVTPNDRCCPIHSRCCQNPPRGHQEPQPAVDKTSGHAS